MKYIFPYNNFYTIITPDDVEGFLKSFDNVSLDPNQHFSWKDVCKLDTKRFNREEVEPLMYPILDKFLLKFKSNFGLRLTDAWNNTYYKDAFQELHWHRDSDLVAVIFLDDYDEQSSKFYFVNRHAPDITNAWSKIIESETFFLDYKRGNVIFFPSHMLHGVTSHNKMSFRRTISLNYSILFR